MTARTAPPFRADHVGSFLRPKALLDARERFAKSEITKKALREAEDAAIRDIVKFQEDLGLQSVTDGEFRRTFFHIDFLEQLAGVEAKGSVNVVFRTSDGKDVGFAPPVLTVPGKVKHVAPIFVEHFQFLKEVTKKTPKIKMLADAGCRYVQLDDTNLAYLCDDKMREGARSRGDDPDELPRRYARLINEAIKGRPADMAACVHLCRGNFKSAWAAQGGYEPVAEVLFNELKVDGYFLEYDDARSGDFAPLRHVPKGKTVVLGLVSTKLGQLESKDDIKRRVDEAAKRVPLEQLALSPQCGFSSTVHGNDIAVEAQAAKLRLVVETAREIWG
jgi:5-methyltetrahydropteroyltriglutamate--homocysteine methyltransferase